MVTPLDKTKLPFVIKISQPGYSVENEDARLIVNSNLPTLMIQKVYRHTFTASEGVVSIPHDLKYAPYIISYQRIAPGFTLAADYEFFPPFQAITVNDTEVLFDSSSFVTYPVDVCIFITTYPIKRNWKSLLGSTDAGTGAKFDPDYGMKVSLKGKDATSKDMRDFSIHSSGRAPLIHHSLYGNGVLGKTYDSTTAAQYTLGDVNELGYPPFCLSAQSQDGGVNWFLKQYFGSNANNYWVQNASDVPMGLLVLKDPVNDRTGNFTSVVI